MKKLGIISYVILIVIFAVLSVIAYFSGYLLHIGAPGPTPHDILVGRLVSVIFVLATLGIVVRIYNLVKK